MRTVTLGRTGLDVSAVGFGGIPIMRVEFEEAERAIHRALDLGVTFIDTATGYGDSQRKIGRAIRGRREGLVLATKTPPAAGDDVLAKVDQSRDELGADVIDLYQLHNVSRPGQLEEVLAPGGALEGLLAARRRGWVRHIGMTSHSLDIALAAVEHDVFETIQFPFNLVTSEPVEKLIPRCRERNTGFIVMKPLCGGQYDNAELAFRFLNSYPDLVPIPGIETPAEIEQIVEIVESGRVLEGETRREAERIAAELGKLFCRRCGYCQPCPNHVPITLGMVFESFTKRFPPERLAEGPARSFADAMANCTDCGLCETQCPYDLPIRETLRKNLEVARRVLNRCGG